MANLIPEPQRINNNDKGWLVRTILNGLHAIFGDAINQLDRGKVNRDEIANLSVGIKDYKSDVDNISDLPKTGNTEGDARVVINDKDENDRSYIWLWNGSSWSRTVFTSFPSDIALRGGSSKTVQQIDDDKAGKQEVVGYYNFQSGYINKDTGSIAAHPDFSYIIIDVKDFKSVFYSLKNFSGGDSVSLIACYGVNNMYLGSLLNGGDVTADINNQEFIFIEGTKKIGLATRTGAILNFYFPELNLLSLDSNKVKKGYENRRGYTNKDTGEIIQNNANGNFWYIVVPISNNIKSFFYTLKNWTGGDVVSLIACYDENGVYLGSLLNGTTTSLVDIVNREFLILENTRTIVLTSRDTATMDCSLLNDDLLVNYQKNIVGIYDDVNREFIKQFNLTSDAIGVVDYKGLVMLKDSGVVHRNFAISKEPDITSVSFVFNPLPTQTTGASQSARIAFGNTRINYFLNFQNNTTGFIDVYFCTPTELVNITTISHSVQFKIGDILRVDRRGLYFKIYVNEILIGAVTGSKGFIDPMGGGFGFRDRNTNFFAKEIQIKKNYPKYMHISVDDTSGVLKDLNVNATTYTSIFDNPIVAFYKQLHDTYGMVISLYCFFDYNGFKLSDMTAKYKDEFIVNSHWLKLGFHAENKDSNYNNVDASVCVADYTKMYNYITIFAGYNSIDHMPRFHFFATKKDALNELKNTCGLKGCLTADDARADNSGLTALERTVLTSCDDYFDHENLLYYCRTEYRMDNDTAASIVPKLDTLYNSTNNRDIYIMFFHEGKTNTQAGKDMLEDCVKWAKDKSIRFDFPQNNI